MSLTSAAPPLSTSTVPGVTETTTTTVTSGAPGVGYGYGAPGSNTYSQTTYGTGYPGAIGMSTVGVAPLGMSAVPVTRTSNVSMGTTTIAPTIYEKAVIQDIPGKGSHNAA